MDYRQLVKNITLIAEIQDTNVVDVQNALNKGADVNYCNIHEDCKTPLHHAVAVGDKGIVELLLKKGADPEARSKDGKKPLDMLLNLASKSKFEGIFQKYGCVIQPISPSSAASLPFLTYTKRKGTSSIRGQLYETKLLALVLFRALHRAAITAFNLATNVDDAGAFDDVVLRYTEGGTDKALYLQAKHKDGKQTNLKDMLDGNAEKGDFSIVKYFRSYLDLKLAEQNGVAIPEELIIFTNIGVDCALPKGSNVMVQIVEVDRSHLFFTTSKGKQIQLEGLLETLKEKAKKWYIEALAGIFAEQFIRSNNGDTLKEFIKNSLAAIDSTKNTLELMLLCNATNLNRGQTRHTNFSKFKNEIVKLLQSGTFPRATLSDVDCCSLITDFSKKLYLYTKQASEDEVEDLLKTEIERYYPHSDDLNLLFHLYHSAVQQWWLQTGQVQCQTKASTLFSNAKRDMQRNTWLKNLQEISMNKLWMFNVEFCISKIQREFTEQIENFMTKAGNDVLYVVCNNQLLSCLKLVQYLNFKSYDFNYIHSDVFDLAQFCGKLETNINCVVLISRRKKDKQILKCLQKYARKIIIISEENSKAKSGAIYDSNKGLVDLTTKCQQEILNREVLFQGMRVRMGALVEDNMESVDEQMLAELIMGDAIDVAPVSETSIQEDEMSYYVERKVSRSALRYEILSDDSFIVVSEEEKIIRFDDKDKDIIVVVNKIRKNESEWTFPEAQTYFDRICCMHPQRNVHLLQAIEANYYNFTRSKVFSLIGLQWVRSQNSIGNIHKYAYVSDIKIELKSLTDVATNLVIVASEPGMGKTTYLTALTAKTQQSDPSVWIIRINLLDFTKTLNEWQQERVQIDEDRAFSFLESAVFGKSADAKTSFGRAIFSVQCKILKKPILLLDGFDEISPDYKETVLSLVNIFRNKLISKMWIATRTGAIQKELELVLNSFAFTLNPFEKSDCIEFLLKFWKTQLKVDRRDENKLARFVDDFYQRLDIVEFRDDDLIRVPLYMKMVASINESDCQSFINDFNQNNEICKSERLNLLALYEQFVEKSFFRLHKEKNKTDVTKPSVKHSLDSSFELFSKKCEILAIYTLFNINNLKWVLSDEERSSFNGILKDDKFLSYAGIIRDMKNNVPVFVHQTYAEYFCALFIFEKYALFECKNKSNAFTKFIETFLTKINFWSDSQITDFLKITIENRKASIISKYLKSKFLLEHLLINYDLIKNISICNVFSCFIEHSIDENGNVDQLTNIIKYTTDINKALLLEATCEMGCIKLFKMIFKFIDLSLFGVIYLRKAAYYGHIQIVNLLLVHNIFDNTSRFKLIETNILADSFINYNALHLAAQAGHVEIVKLLLGNGADVNITSTYGTTPLMEAIVLGHLRVVKLLLESQADANICSNGFMPLHIAATHGNFEITELLLEQGARVNIGITTPSVKVLDGATALFKAALEGHHKVVSLLLAKGAVVDSPLSSDGRTPLMTAARTGHKEVVEILLKNGANCNVRTSDKGKTSLHFAALAGHVEIALLLIQNGAKLDVPSIPDRATPLHLASLHGHLTMAKVLIEKRADINFKNSVGFTPLHYASQFGHVEIVAFLLEKGARHDVTTVDKCSTPLYVAASQGHLNVVLLLLQHGAKVDSPLSSDGRTPLMEATLAGHKKVVEILLKNGANYNARTSDKGSTSLHFAASTGHVEIVLLLIQNGAELDSPSIPDRVTPLHFASQEGHLTVVKVLVEKGADINLKDTNGVTPLHLASQFGHIEIVAFLLEKGAPHGVTTIDNCSTPLYLAASQGHLDVVRLLIQHGAEVDSRLSSDGRTPLMEATLAGHKKVVEILLKMGANCNARTSDKGMTSLHIAALAGHEEIALLLIQNDAELDSPSIPDRITPLHLASMQGHLTMAKVLVEKGADINFKDSQGFKPLHRASQFGHIEIVAFLLEKGAPHGVTTIDNCSTPLYLAASQGHLDVVRLLIQHGAKVGFLFCIPWQWIDSWLRS